MSVFLVIIACGLLYLVFGLGKEPQRPPASPRRPGVPPTPRKKREKPPSTEKILRGRASIIDGDSLRIKGTEVRLYGIDAPEIDHPYGQKAKWALVRLCKGHDLRVEIVAVDDYGRTVATCVLPDGRDLSAEMVKMGLALDWPKYSGGKFAALEQPGVRKRLWLADARQKGRMDVWRKFEARKKAR